MVNIRHVITGAHSIIYSTDPEADRAFMRDVLGLPAVDVGRGWLILQGNLRRRSPFTPPTATIITSCICCATTSKRSPAKSAKGVACAPIRDEGWGLLTQVSLPGGGKLGVDQPLATRAPRPGPDTFR